MTNKKYRQEITTIEIPMKLKKNLQQYGLGGESYSEIIERLLKSAHERLINDLLMDEKDCVSIEEALAEAKLLRHA